MRDSIKKYVEIVAETLPVSEPIVEFGSLQVPGQEGYADLRPFFTGKKYFGCDLRKGPGVNVIADLTNIPLDPETAGAVLILDTLEHVEYLRKAIDEVHRILRKDGLLIISSVMKFPIHEYPHDYWRFTPDGFLSLLRSFQTVSVNYAGEKYFPHTVVGVGCKGRVPEESLEDFNSRVSAWAESHFDDESIMPAPVEMNEHAKTDIARYKRLKRNWFYGPLIRLGNKLINYPAEKKEKKSGNSG